MLLGIWTWLR